MANRTSERQAATVALGQAPAHHVHAALAGSVIVADHRERVGWRHVPTGREVRGGPIRRDREDELDPADIGGEAGTATYGASIAGPGCRRQAAGPIGDVSPVRVR
jgi:hypothetical protein